MHLIYYTITRGPILWTTVYKHPYSTYRHNNITIYVVKYTLANALQATYKNARKKYTFVITNSSMCARLSHNSNVWSQYSHVRSAERVATDSRHAPAEVNTSHGFWTTHHLTDIEINTISSEQSEWKGLTDLKVNLATIKNNYLMYLYIKWTIM